MQSKHGPGDPLSWLFACDGSFIGSGPSVRQRSSPGIHGSSGASPMSQLVLPEGLDRERGTGREREREIEHKMEFDRTKEKEREWERYMEMERRESERVGLKGKGKGES